MAVETGRLYRDGNVRDRKVFAMAGHADGVITFGRTLQEPGTVILHTLALAFQRGAD